MQCRRTENVQCIIVHIPLIHYLSTALITLSKDYHSSHHAFDALLSKMKTSSRVPGFEFLPEQHIELETRRERLSTVSWCALHCYICNLYTGSIWSHSTSGAVAAGHQISLLRNSCHPSTLPSHISHAVDLLMLLRFDRVVQMALSKGVKKFGRRAEEADSSSNLLARGQNPQEGTQ